MKPQLQTLCTLSRMKMKDIYVDEHKLIGWTEITCTDVELLTFIELVLRFSEEIKTWDKPT